MWSIDGLYPVFLASGFTVGFGHCIGMCGPIAVSFSLSLKGKPVLAPHLLYNLGRVITYTVLGGIMGATGSFVQVAGSIAGIQKGTLLFAGGLIVLMGLAMGGWLPVGRVFGDHANPDGRVSRGFRRLTAARSTLAYFPVGLLLGLLPCGPVYTALVAAAGAGAEAASTTAGIARGMGLMLCFGIGTVPALMIVGRLTSLSWLRSRRMVYRAGAALMIVTGIYFIIKGIRY